MPYVLDAVRDMHVVNADVAELNRATVARAVAAEPAS
jgi:hypothetical protein